MVRTSNLIFVNQFRALGFTVMTRPWIALIFLAWAPLALANPVDKSDLNSDGIVNDLDLEIFAGLYFEESYETIDWCSFYESSMIDEKYFREIVSDKMDRYTSLMAYISIVFGCDTSKSNSDKSDLNDDGLVDEADLAIFSTNYLGKNWESVDWCLFYEITIAGDTYEGNDTQYYIVNFPALLIFINSYFNCNAPEPPPSAILLENTPLAPYRLAAANDMSGDIFVSDPKVGSVFIYDQYLVPKAEIKGLNTPLGLAIDNQGRLLVGNHGRKNIEVFDPTNGDLLAVFGEGVVKMPNAITVDAVGRIYVTDSRRGVVWVFTPAYELTGWIGNPGEGQEDLKFPIDAEVALSTQEIFVADQGNNRVQVYDLQGKWIRSIYWNGSGCSWFSGTCTVPKFVGLQALDMDALGRLHVLDRFGSAVIVFDSLTDAQVGNYGSFGTEPGQLRLPTDVLSTQSTLAIVTSGDGDRIETFSVQ
jgi:hypothetical protein